VHQHYWSLHFPPAWRCLGRHHPTFFLKVGKEITNLFVYNEGIITAVNNWKAIKSLVLHAEERIK
jgi:hypothetical protein